MNALKKQHGVATILILLLTGLSLTAAVLGTAYYVRSTQELQISEHALTQAQIKAWTGAQIIQKYVAAMTPQQLKDLGAAVQTAEAATPPGLAMTFAGVDSLSARIMQVDFDPIKTTEPTRFRVHITGAAAEGSRAESKSTLELVYSLALGKDGTPEVPGVSAVKRGVVMFKRKLTISGAVKILEGDIEDLEVIVDDDVESNSPEGLNILRSSGNITLTGTGKYNLIHANGKITMSGSAYAKEIWGAKASAPASADVETSGGVSAAVIRSNGNIKYGVSWGATVAEMYATGEIFAGSNVAKGITGVKKTGNSTDFIKNIEVKPGYKAEVPLVKVEADQKFDAYAYEDKANFAFKRSATGYTKVTVRRMNGIADGEYYLAKSKDGITSEYLCKVLDPKSTTIAPLCNDMTDAIKICNNSNLTCFNYSYIAAVAAKGNTPATPEKHNWEITLNGGDANASILKGVLWFEGYVDVKTGNSKLFNSIIATHDISTSGNSAIVAPNFAGHSDSTFKGSLRSGTNADGTPKFTTTNHALKGICSDSIYPKQFCELPSKEGVKVSAGQFQSNVDGGLGNFALSAGSEKSGVYQGGNINPGAGNIIFGSVWAGNLYANSGNTTIFGYITSLGSGVISPSGNVLGSTTNIGLRELPPTYKQDATLGGSPGTPAVPAVPATNNSATVKWSRYL